MKPLIDQIKNCTECKAKLPHGCNPILQFNSNSKIVIIGQAPGRKVHESSIPWNDQSGDNLRTWLNVTKDQFYNPDLFALLPMGFCYPGKGKSGDLPPLKRCAELWQDKVYAQLKSVELIVLVGKHAQDYYLKNEIKMNLTARVQDYKSYLPKYFVLPHPSPRNNIWQAKNEWFKHLVLPELKDWTTSILFQE
jgi:uracil-DNA glycosylase